ncbi:HlyD family secretion protein, partial [Klebsiella pneumoniae]|nr:HlyD family secretion protein [Klebsiella pneumoniae]
VRVDALPGLVLSGTVESVTPGTGANFSLIPPQNATGNFTKIVKRVPVRIRLAPMAQQKLASLLSPGLSVSVVVDTSPAKGAL